MNIKIALAGNPNCGKTTLYNAITGSNEYVGNRPGVTVEEKEAKLKWDKEITIMDLPGIYSLSPYTSEEVITREYIIEKTPDVILNVVDASNIERNLYLTTQLIETGLPVVIALNMIDVVKKDGDSINIEKLEQELKCKIVPVSALKGSGLKEVCDTAIKAAKSKNVEQVQVFDTKIENYLAKTAELLGNENYTINKKWFAVKLFENDAEIIKTLSLNNEQKTTLSEIIKEAEKEYDDDTESIITNERYAFIEQVVSKTVKKARSIEQLSFSDKIDKVLTNKILALPIFAVIMWLVYYISVSSLGSIATDWANDGVFGEGWHLPFTGSVYEEKAEEFEKEQAKVDAFLEEGEKENLAIINTCLDTIKTAVKERKITEITNDDIKNFKRNSVADEPDEKQLEEFFKKSDAVFSKIAPNGVDVEVEGEETVKVTAADFKKAFEDNNAIISAFKGSDEESEASELIKAEFIEKTKDLEITIEEEDGSETIVNSEDFLAALEAEEPDPSEYGVWIKGIPVYIEELLDAADASDWVKALVLDGIVAGVGSVLGFVPQILILFFLLAILEDCGYMARIAFILDRLFRKFGLSGKSFIPVLIGTGCGVPGIMASRTIENNNDRRLTIMTTTFIPCSAKLPIISLIAGALFGGESWVAPSAYFLGIAAIIISGIVLKRLSAFSGDPSPFVMELPAYHFPAIKGLFVHMWDKGKAFIKKAGTIIFIACAIIWALNYFDWSFNPDAAPGESILASIGNLIAPLFAPLGFGNWESSVATVTGLAAKENVVGTFGVLYGLEEVAEEGTEIWALLQEDFTVVSAYAFLSFNLLCAPCFAAMGAIRREMASFKWTAFAIIYQTLLAYVVALLINLYGNAILFGGSLVAPIIITIAIIALIAFIFIKKPLIN